MARLSTGLVAAIAVGVACTQSPPTAVRSLLTHLHFNGSVSAASTSSDVTSLVTALGGNSSVAAFYDARDNITTDTTGGVTTVTTWQDARGTGFGPDLVMVRSGKKYEPKYIGSAGPILFSSADTTVLQTASAAAMFDVSTALTLVYVGSQPASSAGWGYLGIASDTINGPLNSLILGNGGHTTSYVRGGLHATVSINTGVSVSGTGLSTDSLRIAFVATNGGAGSGMQATIVNATPVTGSGGTAPTSTSNYLTIGAYHEAPSGYVNWSGSPLVQDVIVLDRVATTLDIQEISCWAVAERGINIVGSTTLSCPDSVRIFPASGSVSTSGGTLQYTDTVYDQNGHAMVDPGAVTWSVTNSTLATINSSGLLTAKANGTDTVSASVPVWSGALVTAHPAAVTITNQSGIVTTVKVFPNPFTYYTKDVHQFTDTVYDQNGTVMTGQTVTWASKHTNVATVNTTGLVTDLINGVDTITVTDAGVVGSAVVTYAPKSVKVFPSTASITTNGGTKQFTDTAYDVSNNALTGQSFTWSSSSTSLATVSSSGLATAVGNGTDTVKATDDGVVGSAVLTITGQSGSGAYPNEPPGMTAVVDVGNLTVAPCTTAGCQWTTGGNIPATYTMNTGPSDGHNRYPTLSSDGLGGDTVTGGGYRVNWYVGDSLDDATWWYQSTQWSGSRGTGWLYYSFWVRLMPGMTYHDLQTSDGFKIIKVTNTDSGGADNPIMDILPANLTSSSNHWGPLFGLQDSTAYKGNVVSADSASWFTGGTWHQIELVVQPNSTPGSSDGEMSEYVDGHLSGQVTNAIVFGHLAKTMGWDRDEHFVARSGHTATNKTTTNTHIDINKIYIAVK